MATEKTYKFISVILFFVLIIIVAWIQFAGSEGAADEHEVLAAPDIGAGAPTSVETAIVKKQELIVRITAIGRTRAFRQVTMQSQLSGLITAVPVSEGDYVKKGQLLARIDPTLFRLKLDEAREALTQATIKYGEKIGDGQQTTLRPELKGALLSVEKSQDLYDNALIANKQGKLSNDETAFAERELAAAKIFAEKDKRTIIASRTGLTQALVRVKQAELDLKNAEIRAQFSGAIGDIKIVVGQRVAAGEDLFTLLDNSKLLIDTQVLESESALIKKGRKAKAIFTAFAGEVFHGSVISVNPLIDIESKTRRATILLPNKDRRLIPGMYSFVKIDAKIYKDRLIVPNDAVVLRDRREVVFAVRQSEAKKKTAEWNYVKIGVKNDDFTEITWSKFNIQEGDTVITSNNYTMSHDATVKPVKPRKK